LAGRDADRLQHAAQRERRENLTDTRAQLYANYQQYKAVTVNRPRTIGLHFSYHFKDD
jgi:hypothetical protein